MSAANETRRRFITHFAGAGLGATLAPGIIWAKMQEQGASRITLEMVITALKLAGIESTETEREALVNAANRALTGYEAIRAIDIPNDVSPPFHFSALVPGIEVDKTRQAVPAERGAGGEAAGESRGRRFLARPASRGADPNEDKSRRSS